MSDKLTFLRAFPSEIERHERTLTGRLVPYNHPTLVMDILPDGKRDIYHEGFRSGAFGPQANSQGKGVISKIGLVHAHEGGLGYLGPFSMLREETDGLYGAVNVLPSKADDVAHLLREGVDELSIEFRIARPEYTEVDGDGVRWRTRAHLDRVALEGKGAYSQAQVLAYRAEIDEVAAEQEAHQKELDAAQAALDAEKARIEAEAEAGAQRRAKFDELASRLDSDLARQNELVKQYGASRPPSWP